MAMGQHRNTPVVPQSMRILDQMKYEIARELGIQVPQDGYWGTMLTRDTGAIGGHMTRRLIEIGEEYLGGRSGVIH